MNKLQNIVVGTDFSDCARLALKQAIRLAKWNQAKVHVLHVVDPMDITSQPEISVQSQMIGKELLMGHATRALTDWAKEVAGQEPVFLKVAIGKPIEQFLEYLRRVNCDLAILGVHGLNHPDERDLGIFATKALRKAPCNVMLITRAEEQRFSRLVACIDFSDTALEVAQQTMQIAARDQSEVLFLHVFGVSSQCLPYGVPELETSPDALKAFRIELQERLRSFVPSEDGVACRFEVTESCNYGEAIGQFAKSEKADLIVIGTKGKSNLSYVLLGSTAERLVRALPCSTLVVKAQ